MGGGWSSSRAAAFRRSLADPRDGGDDGHGPSREHGVRELGGQELGGQQRVEPGTGQQGAGQHVAQQTDQGRRGGRGTHCWVLMPDADPMPGVVAGWRRDGAGAWEARVAYALGDDGTAGTSGVVTGWLPASCLRPYQT